MIDLSQVTIVINIGCFPLWHFGILYKGITPAIISSKGSLRICNKVFV